MVSEGHAPKAPAPARKLPNAGSTSCFGAGVGATSLVAMMDDPGARPKKHSVESLSSDVAGSRPRNDEDEGEDGGDDGMMLTPADGGLVCGVVSHVKALTALASQKSQAGNV